MKNFGWTEFSETLNGRLAMIGVVAMIGSYFATGQIVPGLW